MESKLTLPILAGYLPYEVKAIATEEIDLEMITVEKGDIMILGGVVPKNKDWYFPDGNGDQIEGAIFICGEGYIHSTESFKLLLRPLSSLTKQIEHNGEMFVPIEYFEIGDDSDDEIDYGKGNVKMIGLLKDMARHNFIQTSYMPYGVIKKLLEWHYDIFGGIEAGWALNLERPTTY